MPASCELIGPSSVFPYGLGLRFDDTVQKLRERWGSPMEERRLRRLFQVGLPVALTTLSLRQPVSATPIQLDPPPPACAPATGTYPVEVPPNSIITGIGPDGEPVSYVVAGSSKLCLLPEGEYPLWDPLTGHEVSNVYAGPGPEEYAHVGENPIGETPRPYPDGSSEPEICPADRNFWTNLQGLLGHSCHPAKDITEQVKTPTLKVALEITRDRISTRFGQWASQIAKSLEGWARKHPILAGSAILGIGNFIANVPLFLLLTSTQRKTEKNNKLTITNKVVTLLSGWPIYIGGVAYLLLNTIFDRKNKKQ